MPAPSAPPRPPVYAPEIDASGEPAPLGARRVAWRPSDEPPVEEWRREGLAESAAAAAAATAPTAPLVDDPTFTSPPVAYDLPLQQAEEEVAPSMFDTPPTFDVPAPDTDAPDTGVYDTGDFDTAAWDVPPTVDAPSFEPPPFEPPSFGSTFDSAFDAGPSFDASGAPNDPPGFNDQIPLPPGCPASTSATNRRPTPKRSTSTPIRCARTASTSC